MSIIDGIFVFIYCMCGLALGLFCVKHFGPIYGLIGFVVGFAIPMILWRFIASRLGRKKP